MILVEKANKQGNSQSTAHPQHHPIPKLLHVQATQLIHRTRLKEDTLVYVQMQLPAILMRKSLQTRKRNLARNYRVSGGPWAIVNDRTTKWLVLLQGACSLAMHV